MSSAFKVKYTKEIPQILHGLGCSIALSTYDTSKVIFLSSRDSKKVSAVPLTFKRPMGLAVEDGLLAVASLYEVNVFKTAASLAKLYPGSKGVFDAMYLPQCTYYTGKNDLHDLAFGSGGLWTVNTLFSCLSTLDYNYSFTPRWKPFFIDAIEPEDRCHLNGLAMQNGEPAYVTALGQSNQKKAWKETILYSGIVMEVKANKILTSGLAVPHSPRFYKEELYILQSGKGELGKIDVNTGLYQTILQLGTFVRGMAFYKDYCFIGMSKMRKSSNTFKKLEGMNFKNQSGIVVLDMAQKRKVGEILFENGVDELFEVQVLKNTISPGLIGTYNELHQGVVHLPTGSYWQKETPKNSDA